MAVTAADVTLTVVDTGDLNADAQSRNFNLACSGALTGNRAVIVPATARYYRVSNACTGSFTLTVKTAAGTGVVVPQGLTMTLWCDATNVVGGMNFTSMTSVNAQSGTTYTILSSDLLKFVTLSNPSPVAVTIPQASAIFSVGWSTTLMNNGGGLVTLTPTTSTIDGAASLALPTNQSVVLFSDGTNWFTNRGARLFRGALLNLQAAQSIPNNTFTTVTSWNTTTAVYDTSSFYSTGTPNRLTIPTGVSVVRLFGSCSFALTAAGNTAQIRFTKNGSSGVNGCSWASETVGAAVTVTVPIAAPPLQVSAGDYFQVQVYQNTGGALNLTGAGDQSYFGIEALQ